jgi:hypothetical protein
MFVCVCACVCVRACVKTYNKTETTLHKKLQNTSIYYKWAYCLDVHTLLQWKSNKFYTFWVCVGSLRYPTRNVHAPYYTVICGMSDLAIIFHIFWWTSLFLVKQRVLISSATFVQNISHAMKSWTSIKLSTWSCLEISMQGKGTIWRLIIVPLKE